MQPNKYKTYALITFSMLIWGISYILLEQLYNYITPFTTAAIRVFIATAFLISISLISKKLKKVKRKDIPVFMLFALIDPFLYFILESYGLKYSSPTIAAIFIATIPLLTPVAAAIIAKERLTVINFVGIAISFTGVLLVIVERNFTISILPIGLIFLLGAVFCAIAYNFFIKKLSDKYNLYTIITTQNFFSTIYFIPLFIVYSANDFATAKFDFLSIIYILILSIFASALAFFFYAKGIKEIGITKANVFTNMIPVFTAIFAYFILGDTLNFQKMTGIALVVLGLFFAQNARIKLKF